MGHEHVIKVLNEKNITDELLVPADLSVAADDVYDVAFLEVWQTVTDFVAENDVAKHLVESEINEVQVSEQNIANV